MNVESHASAASLLESGEQRYIKATNNNNKSYSKDDDQTTVPERGQSLCFPRGFAESTRTHTHNEKKIIRAAPIQADRRPLPSNPLHTAPASSRSACWSGRHRVIFREGEKYLWLRG